MQNAKLWNVWKWEKKKGMEKLKPILQYTTITVADSASTADKTFKLPSTFSGLQSTKTTTQNKKTQKTYE